LEHDLLARYISRIRNGKEERSTEIVAREGREKEKSVGMGVRERAKNTKKP
jgi:hypothetical protein